MPKKL